MTLGLSIRDKRGTHDSVMVQSGDSIDDKAPTLNVRPRVEDASLIINGRSSFVLLYLPV